MENRQRTSLLYLDKKLFYVKATIYALSLLCYAIYDLDDGPNLLILSLFAVLLSYNLILSKFLPTQLPKLVNYYISIVDVILIGIINYQTGNYGFLQYLFFLPIIAYSLRFGLNPGIITAFLSWVGYASGLLARLGNSSQSSLNPGDLLIPGLIYLLVAWFIGYMSESEKRLNIICLELESMANIDSKTGVFKYLFFKQHLAVEMEACRTSNHNLSVIVLAVDEFQSFVDRFGRRAGERLLQQIANIIKENIRGKDKAARASDEEFSIMLPGADSLDTLDIAERIRISVNKSTFVIPEISVKCPVSVSMGIATFPKDAIDQQNLIYRANQALYRARHSKRNRVCLSSVNINEVQNKIRRAGDALADSIPSLVAILDAKDVNTCGHSERVTKYAVAIAKQLHVSEEELENIQYGALLHDIGKINVEEHILDKPGRLSDNERYSIRNHPEFGANFLMSIDYLKKITPLVLYHHERWDGSGYPYGIQGESIPLGARIIGVADSFDAMVSERPYKAALTPAEALQEIIKCSETQFDPKVVDAFEKIYASLGFESLTSVS